MAKNDLFSNNNINKDGAMNSIQLVVDAYQKIKKFKHKKGYIKCPKCGKKLYYTKSDYNGHIWGKCETDKCLSWMQ